MDPCLAEGMEQSVNVEVCLSVSKQRIKWRKSDGKVEKSTTVD